MASTWYRSLKEHVELCSCARKTKDQTINAENKTSAGGLLAALLASLMGFGLAWRRRERVLVTA